MKIAGSQREFLPGGWDDQAVGSNAVGRPEMDKTMRLPLDSGTEFSID